MILFLISHRDTAGGLMFYRCHFLFLMSPISFDNEWTDRNADCCINTVDENNFCDYNFGER